MSYSGKIRTSHTRNLSKKQAFMKTGSDALSIIQNFSEIRIIPRSLLVLRFPKLNLSVSQR